MKLLLGPHYYNDNMHSSFITVSLSPLKKLIFLQSTVAFYFNIHIIAVAK